MTAKTRRTEIQIETHEVKVIRFRGKQFLVHRDASPAETEMLAPDEAAELLRMAGPDVFRFIGAEKGNLDLENVPDGKESP